ncbi:MAG TPA: hypothetical protein VJU61_26120, partial [Polyangiaceae bacterium]|nr:hypothetical protein [Polyangiaceae bacterium]
LALAAAAALVLLPLSSGDWVVGHNEGMRYLALAEHFREALLETQGYPRWLPRLYGGYGYPTFVFYQPLIFFLDAAWSVLFHGTRALWAALFSLLFAGSSAVFLLARRYGGVIWSLAVAGIFLLSPYLYVDLYVRHALAELASLLLAPWLLFSVLQLHDRIRAREPKASAIALVAVSQAALVYAHPLTSFLLDCSLLPVWLATCLRGRRLALADIWPLALGIGLGVLLSALYWLPTVLMSGEVNMDGASQGYSQATRHTVHWFQFFSREWGFGGSAEDSPDDGMPFQLGAAHFALAVVAFGLARKTPLVISAFVAYLAVILAMTPWCAWLWRLPGFERTQFPWRMLVVTTVLQSFLLAAAGGQFSRLRHTWQRLAAAGGLLLGVALWQEPQFQLAGRIEHADQVVRAEFDTARNHVQRYNGADEFRPKTTPRGDPRPLGDSPLLSADHGRLTFAPESTAFAVVAELETNRTTWLSLHQLYLPGWLVTLDGRPIRDEKLRGWLDRRGAMRIRVPVESGVPQRIRIEARYAGPRGQRAAEALALLALVAWCGFAWFERRQPRPGPVAAAAG